MDAGPIIETEKIRYCRGYKYQLRADAWFFVGIRPPVDAVTDLVVLRRDGWLQIRKYFAWDGCSGPTWDDRTNARACLIHDALYYLMRVGQLDAGFRPAVDALLAEFMRRDGAWSIRAAYYEKGVGLFGARQACGDSVRVVYTAP